MSCAKRLAHGAHHVADVLEEVGAAGLHVGSELHHQEIRDRVLKSKKRIGGSSPFFSLPQQGQQKGHA